MTNIFPRSWHTFFFFLELIACAIITSESPQATSWEMRDIPPTLLKNNYLCRISNFTKITNQPPNKENSSKTLATHKQLYIVTREYTNTSNKNSTQVVEGGHCRRRRPARVQHAPPPKLPNNRSATQNLKFYICYKRFKVAWTGICMKHVLKLFV
jgi:hypothetical protein